MKRIAALSAAIVALLASASAHATYVFTTIDMPGSANTTVWAINDNGQAVVNGDNGTAVYQNGAYTLLPAGPATFSSYGASGINNVGTIVGTAFAAGANPTQSGFILNGSTYTLVTQPGYDSTEFWGVSSSGLISGWSFGSTGGTAFVYDPTIQHFTNLNLPYDSSDLVITQGVNSAGQAVGSFIPTSGSQTAFLYQAGTYSTFQINGGYTAARGINDNGLITGYFLNGGITDSFVGTSSGYQILSAPGAARGTIAESINNAGQVAGFWTDATGVTHGFIADPAVLPTGTTTAGAYTFSTSVVPDVPIFIDPTIAVGYQYQIGVGDPYFAGVALPIGIGDNLYSLSSCDGTQLGKC